MPSIDPRDLWPDAETLAAGDEDLVFDPLGEEEDRLSPSGLPIVNARTYDYMDANWPRSRPYQEDGHLANDAYRNEHQDAKDRSSPAGPQSPA